MDGYLQLLEMRSWLEANEWFCSSKLETIH